jgi:anti-sigma-K factor RskA
VFGGLLAFDRVTASSRSATDSAHAALVAQWEQDLSDARMRGDRRER